VLPGAIVTVLTPQEQAGDDWLWVERDGSTGWIPSCCFSGPLMRPKNACLNAVAEGYITYGSDDYLVCTGYESEWIYGHLLKDCNVTGWAARDNFIEVPQRGFCPPPAAPKASGA
jgi:hypothetical protein